MDASSSFLCHPTSFFLGVSLCRLLPVASWKSQSIHPNNASKWRHVLGRAYKDDELSTHTSSQSKSSNRRKLIELFKRIQIEISEGESSSDDYDQNLEAFSDDNSYVETSVLEFLQNSNTKSKGKTSNLNYNSEYSNHKKRTVKKKKPIPTPQPLSTTNFSRPPSNFVKKSPIPSLTPLRSNDIEDLKSESPKIEEMKLSELKELAKQRGLKGYSKLKKSELVQLLKS